MTMSVGRTGVVREVPGGSRHFLSLPTRLRRSWSNTPLEDTVLSMSCLVKELRNCNRPMPVCVVSRQPAGSQPLALSHKPAACAHDFVPSTTRHDLYSHQPAHLLHRTSNALGLLESGMQLEQQRANQGLANPHSHHCGLFLT